MLTILIITVFILWLGWKVGTSIFDAITGYNKPDKPSKDTFITHHHHHYDNRSVHFHDTNQLKEDQKRFRQ